MIQNYNHDEFTKKLIRLSENRELCSKLLDFEAEVSTMDSSKNRDFEIYKKYKSLQLPDDFLKDFKFWENRKVTLHGKELSPISFSATILNRFVIFILLELEAITHQTGDLGQIKETDNGFEVPFNHNKTEPPGIFDEIIVRHGPESLVQQLFDSPVKSDMSLQPDISHERLWPDKYFDPDETYGTNSMPEDKRSTPPTNHFLTNVPSSLPNFIGREDIILSIHKKLKTANIVIISGPAGIGKTSVVLKYIEEQTKTQAYNYIAWIPLQKELTEELVSSIKWERETLLKSGKTIDEQFAIALSILKTDYSGNNLLVIDNLESIDRMNYFIPKLKTINWNVILITQQEITDFDCIKLDIASRQDAIEIFKTNTVGSNKPLSSSKVKKFLKKVDYNTYLAQLLGKMSMEGSISLKHLEQAILQPSLHSNTLLRDLFELHQLSEHTQQFLRILCLFPEQVMVKDLFKILRNSFEADKNIPFDTLVELNRNGWIQLVYKTGEEEKTGIITMHSLVKRMISEKVKLNEPIIEKIIGNI